MYIIADIGSNWFNKQDCLDGIIGAKKAGADCVKFQLFDHKALYGYSQDINELSRVSLPRDWIKSLARYAKSVNIDFMCSAFSAELLEVVDPYVDRHKVASSDLLNPELLEAIAKTGKPVILSCGGHNLYEIRTALRFFKDYHPSEIALMYCVSEYPSYEHDIDNLLRMSDELMFEGELGYSDHSKDVFCAPCYSAMIGATVLEKHLNCLKTSKITPDKVHSLDVDQFYRMALKLKSPEVFMNAKELDMKHKHKRMAVAIKHIPMGGKLEYKVNWGFYRSKEYVESPITATNMTALYDRVANVSIDIGEAITGELVR